MRPKKSRPDNLQAIYEKAGSLETFADEIGVTYVTAQKIVKEEGLTIKRQGYTAPTLPFTGKQCRLAREFLNYTRDEMCKASNVGKTALSRFEQGKDTPRLETVEKISFFFKTRNIIFTDESIFIEDTLKKKSR